MVSLKYVQEIEKIFEKKREKREYEKLNNVRQEIIDLKEDLKSMPQVLKEMRKSISEKEKMEKQQRKDIIEMKNKIKEEKDISKVVEGEF